MCEAMKGFEFDAEEAGYAFTEGLNVLRASVAALAHDEVLIIHIGCVGSDSAPVARSPEGEDPPRPTDRARRGRTLSDGADLGAGQTVQERVAHQPDSPYAMGWLPDPITT
jgi:hypothetical protein